MRDYGRAIKLFRKRTGYTQAQLAQRLNVTYQTVSKWEKGTNTPHISVVESLCAEFSVTLDEFLRVADGGELNGEVKASASPVESGSVAPPEERRENITDKNDADITDKSDASAYAGTHAAAKRERFANIALKPWQIAVIAVVAVVVILVAVLVPVLLARDTERGGKRVLTANQVYERLDPSVFCIEVNTQNGETAGTGFFTGADGAAVTNYHVIKGATSIKIKLGDGREYVADKILGYDIDRDVALIHVDITRSVPVTFGSSASVRTGDKVYAIGYPQSFVLGAQDSTLTDGIVSKPSYSVEGVSYIQSTVDITHGNSGGVLVNEYGEVIGMTTAGISLGNVSYMNLSVPSDAVRRVQPTLNVTVKEYSASYGKQYTVTYYVGDGIYRTESVSAMETVRNITPELDGDYEFLGWYDDAELTKAHDFGNRPTANLSLYAKCRFDAVTAVFVGGTGASGAVRSIAVGDDGMLTLPDNGFTRTGHKFGGWRYNGKLYAAGETVTVGNGQSPVAFKAEWIPFKYTVAYAYGGSSSRQICEYDRTETLLGEKFTRRGYTQTGWSLGGKTYGLNAQVKNLATTDGAVVTAEPVWEPIKYRTLVVLGSDYAEFDGESDPGYVMCTYGEIPLEGHTVTNVLEFTGWTYYVRGTEYTGDPRYINDDPDEIVEAVANWRSSRYNLYLYQDYYDSRELARVYLAGTESYTLPLISELVPEPPQGKRFVRWVQKYTDTPVYFEDGATVSDLMVNGYLYGGYNVNGTYCSVELAGEWAPIEFTVEFAGGVGGLGSMQKATYKYGEKAVLPQNKFTKNGYSFAGWEYDGKVYADCADISDIVDTECILTFTARWVKNLSGGGTQADPYVINCYDALASLRDIVDYAGGRNAYYKLAADIDCAGKPLYAIGTAKSFRGVFDGNGHKISNALFMPTADDDAIYYGLFGRVFGGQIKDVGIADYAFFHDENGYVFGSRAAPLVCSYISDKPIERCYAVGEGFKISNCELGVTGGLIGELRGGATDCYARTSVAVDVDKRYQYSQAIYVGGLAARIGGGTMTDFPSSDDGDSITTVGALERCYADITLVVNVSNKNLSQRIYSGLLAAEFDANEVKNSVTVGEMRYDFASDDNTLSGLKAFSGLVFGYFSQYSAQGINVYTSGKMIFTDTEESKGAVLNGQTDATKEQLTSIDWLCETLGFDRELWSAFLSA